jgi:hypothetical protein
MEGACAAPGTLPLRALITAASNSLEREEYQWCFDALKGSSVNSRALASLRLRLRIATLLDSWQRHAPQSRSPRGAVDNAIAVMIPTRMRWSSASKTGWEPCSPLTMICFSTM